MLQKYAALRLWISDLDFDNYTMNGSCTTWRLTLCSGSRLYKEEYLHTKARAQAASFLALFEGERSMCILGKR